MVEQLQDIIELQSIYINALGFDLKNKAAEDVFYDQLCIKMDKLDHDSDIFAVLYKAIENTQTETHKAQISIQVRDIYDLYKPSEKLRFAPFENKLHNKFLLWNGVKPQSMAATLRDGIRMPYAKSAQTGYMFGKGIYFTDCVSKAALQSLSGNKKASNRCFMILSEVALGDMHKAYAPY